MKKKFNYDGWKNLFTGQGVVGKDKQLANQFVRGLKLTDTTLDNLYRGDGFGKRIVNLINGEIVREWFEVIGDTDGEINKYLANLKAKSFCGKALRWADVFGGSALVLGLNDGGKFEDPLDINQLKGIEFLRVYDRRRVTWTHQYLYSDPNDKKFGLPQFYDITPVNNTATVLYKVHESRLILFDGRDVTDQFRVENNGWGDSIYQSIFEQLSNLNGSYFSVKNILDDFIQTIIKLNNLEELLAAGEEDQIRTRMEIMDLSRHIMNMIFIDKNEEYEKKSSTITGIPDVMDRFSLALSAVTGIPLTLLMGQSPAGLNATGASDIRQWYDKISAEQEERFLTAAERLVFLSMVSKEGPTKGKILDGWGVEFNPLWQPTDKEICETRKTQAESDGIYIDRGVLTAEEVAQSRFGGEEYSHETTLDETIDRSPVTEEPIEKPTEE